MANALQWIIREAKHLRSKDRNRKEWKQYVAQASAIYARKHKGKSPVGKKRKGSLGIAKETIVKKFEKKGYKITFTMSGNVIASKGQKQYSAKTLSELNRIVFGGISGVNTASRTHTDKNRITANIQVGKLGAASAGSLKSELKKRITEKIDYLILRKYHASKKRDKTKLQKQISAENAELRKLS